MPRVGSGLKIRKSSESTAFDLSGTGDISATEVSVFLATRGYETGFEDDRPVWLPAEPGPDKSLTEWQEQIPCGNNRIQPALIGGLCLFSPPAFAPSPYKKTDMDIPQQPGAFCFSSALKDTVIPVRGRCTGYICNRREHIPAGNIRARQRKQDMYPWPGKTLPGLYSPDSAPQ
jgi:hypothetical protein